jgi:hypothetical protein
VNIGEARRAWESISGGEVAGNVGELEAVLGPEGEQHRVVVRGSLQLEVEAAAEALPQCEPEAPVDAPAERSVDDELHATGLVEEALEDHVLTGGDHTERGASRVEIAGERVGNVGGQPFGREPGDRALDPTLFETLGHGRAKRRDLVGELGRASRGLPEPERDRGRHPFGVAHTHDTVRDAADAPGGAAEQEDVAHHALDREVFVHRAHEGVVGLGDHAVVGVLRDGAPGGERDEPSATPAAQQPVHLVAMEPGSHPSSAGADPFPQHRDDGVEVLARELRIRRRPAHQREQLVLAPGLGRAGRHDLLGEHVQGPLRRMDAVESAGAHAAQQRRALHQLVSAQREEATLGRPSPSVTGAPHPLEERGKAARRADLAHQVHGTDVDAQLERRRRHEGPQIARAQARLETGATLLGEAPVVRTHAALAQPLGEEVSHTLGQPARVHEHQRRPVLGDKLRDPVEHLAELLGGRHRFELATRDVELEIESTLMAEIDDPAGRRHARARGSALPHQEPGQGRDGLLGGGEPDALGRCVAQLGEPLERERQMRAALVAREGVDLVDDHRVDGAEQLAAAPGGQQQIEGLGCGDQKVRGPAQHRGPGRSRRVAAAHAGADRRQLETPGGCQRADLRQRQLEVVMDVGGERLQRRHVDDPGLVGKLPQRLAAPEQHVDLHQEGRQGLAATGGGCHEGVLAAGNRGPALGLGLRRAAREAALEPTPDGRVEERERVPHGPRPL